MDALAVIAKKAFELAVNDAIRRVLAASGDQAFSDLMEELRLANISPEEAAADDKTAARMVSFFVAMSQGAARRNLKVMAQIIAKRAAHPLRSEDDFVSWADTIAALRREEVILLATFHRQQLAGLKGFDLDVQDEANEHRHLAMLEVNKLVKAELIGPTKPFRFELIYLATASALSRTGLLMDYPVIDGKHFQTTVLMRDLAEMIRLEEWAKDALTDSDAK